MKRADDPENQPTIDQINQAWTNAINCELIPGARGESRRELEEIRNKRTTWIGTDQNRLRISIDRYLRGDRDL